MWHVTIACPAPDCGRIAVDRAGDTDCPPAVQITAGHVYIAGTFCASDINCGRCGAAVVIASGSVAVLGAVAVTEDNGGGHTVGVRFG